MAALAGYGQLRPVKAGNGWRAMEAHGRPWPAMAFFSFFFFLVGHNTGLTRLEKATGSAFAAFFILPPEILAGNVGRKFRPDILSGFVVRFVFLFFVVLPGCFKKVDFKSPVAVTFL